MSGLTSYQAGLAAEEIVERHYQRGGLTPRSRRWRGSGGEIDLVLQDKGALIFVEVKKSATFARAAERVTQRQIRRIHGAMSEFLAGEPNGQNTDVRFDVALVDARGAVEVIENAYLH